MVSPSKLLPWLLGGALAAGGVLQGLHWRSLADGAGQDAWEAKLRAKDEQIAELKRRIESLEQGGGSGREVSVPPELVARVESEYGLKFEEPPVVRSCSADELRDRISASLEGRFGPGGADHRETAWRLIGWLRPEDKLIPQLTAVRSVGARAWFDDATGEAWVTGQYDPQAVPDQAAMVRLLTRTLLHRHFPPSPSYPGDEPARTREALHQGAASGAEARFFAANARAIGFMPLKENTGGEQLLASLSPFLQGITTFPALEGKGFADTKFIQGNEVFQQTLRTPPHSTRGILRPDAPEETAPEIARPDAASDALLEESGGELGLKLWLAPLAEDADSAGIADGWRGDRYRLFPEGEGTALVWDIVLATPEAADKLQAAALELLAAESGADEAPAAGTPVENPEGRKLAVYRVSPVTIRFANAASVETMNALAR